MEDEFNLGVSLEELETRLSGNKAGINLTQNMSQVDKVDVVDVRPNDKNTVDILEEVTGSLMPVIPFPIEVFPQRFRETIEKVSISSNVDSEVCASAALAVIGSTIGNTIKLRVRDGWGVLLSLWMVVIAISGYGKTHAINHFVKPIDRRQAKAYRKYQALMQVYRRKMEAYKKNRDLSALLPDKPVLEQFKSVDFTIEALADVLESQPRGVLIHQDELAGMILSLNQYKGGKGSDRQHLLELFNCESWKLDRKSGSRFIHNTFASIIGGVQPQIMPKIFDTDSFNDGLLPRFLFVNASSKIQRFSRVGITDGDLVYWNDLITFCFDIPLIQDSEGYVEPKVLILSSDALNLWESFFNEYHELAAFLPGRLKVFIPKLITYSLKLAGILHILDCFECGIINNVVSAKTVSDAIKLTNYYAGQAVVLVNLYDRPARGFNEYENRIIQTLNKLRGEVLNGKLHLSKIAEEFNGMLPERLRIKDNKNIGAILKRLNLETQKSTGGVYFLIWEDEKIKNLLKATSTMSTTSTTSTQKAEKQETVVTDDSGKISEEIPEIEFIEEVKTNV